MSAPENPEEAAYLDAYSGGNLASFSGAWSTYPFFGSKTVLISSIGEGLFVVQAELTTEAPVVRFVSDSTAVAEDGGPGLTGPRVDLNGVEQSEAAGRAAPVDRRGGAAPCGIRCEPAAKRRVLRAPAGRRPDPNEAIDGRPAAAWLPLSGPTQGSGITMGYSSIFTLGPNTAQPMSLNRPVACNTRYMQYTVVPPLESEREACP